VPSMDPQEDRSAGSPVMPSFASLRGPTRRSPVDLLLPGEPPPAPVPESRPVRPPEWADLVHLAAHVVRRATTLPTRWMRRLLGS
jgi:hypothetical protein